MCEWVQDDPPEDDGAMMSDDCDCQKYKGGCVDGTGYWELRTGPWSVSCGGNLAGVEVTARVACLFGQWTAGEDNNIGT